MLTWMIFSGLFDLFHLGLGVISSLFVTFLTGRLLWQRTDIPLGTRMRQYGGLAKYIAWLMGQIVLSNWYILQLAFSSKQRIQPVIVKRRTKLRTDFARYVFAQSITLTPGTVTVKIEGDELIVHAINRKAAESMDGSMERRIATVLEPQLLHELREAAS